MVDGNHLAGMSRQMFGTERISTEQLSYLLDMTQTSTYLLRNHTIRNHPITFVISDRDQTKRQSHRP
jgi:hypothetical protein